MDPALSEILARRKRINTGREPAPCRSELSNASKSLHHKMQGNFNPYTAFPNLSRKQVKEYEKTFKNYEILLSNKFSNDFKVINAGISNI